MTYWVRQPSSVFSEEHRAMLKTVVEARRTAGLSQRDLAARIGKCPSHVGMIERGQRRIEALELYRMAKAFEIDPVEFLGRIARRIEAETTDISPAPVAPSPERTR